MSGTLSQPLQPRLLSSNMGDDGSRCWVLDGNEDQEKVAERLGVHGLHTLLPHRSRTGG